MSNFLDRLLNRDTQRNEVQFVPQIEENFENQNTQELIDKSETSFDNSPPPSEDLFINKIPPSSEYLASNNPEQTQKKNNKMTEEEIAVREYLDLDWQNRGLNDGETSPSINFLNGMRVVIK